MKTRIIFLMIAIAAVLAITFSVILIAPWETQRVVSEPQPTPSPTPPVSAVVQNITGQGEVQRYGNTSQNTLRNGTIINEGDIIHVGQESSIEVIFTSGSMLSAQEEILFTVGASFDEILGMTPLITMEQGKVSIIAGSPVVIETTDTNGNSINAVAIHSGSVDLLVSPQEISTVCLTSTGCRFSNQTGYYDLESGPNIVFSSPQQSPEMITFE